MPKLMIAEHSEELCTVLSKILSKDFETVSCRDGETAHRMIEDTVPDILILDLDLPNLDGLTLLRMLGSHIPPVVLAMGRFLDDYVLQQAKDLGIQMVLNRPVRPQAIVSHVTQLWNFHNENNHTDLDYQKKVSTHLRILNIPSHREGFQQLRVGIPLYAQDPHQSICKDLYPAIAKICGNSNGKQVEKNVRDAIKYAWAHRNEPVWQQYFPNHARLDPR